MRRELIKWLQDNVQSVEQRAGEQLAKAALRGLWEDDFILMRLLTLRLSYGQVKGYPMNGMKAPSHTTLSTVCTIGIQFRFEGSGFNPAGALCGGQREPGPSDAALRISSRRPMWWAGTRDRR